MPIVEDFFEILADGIKQVGEVKISGFGNFSTRDKKARPGRNPKTLEPCTISARRVVTFTQGGSLKERLNN